MRRRYQRPARTYYVDATAGSDTNSGAIDKPLQSIAAINALTLKPGDRVLFKRGETWRGLVYPKPKTYFGNYGSGALPRVLGSLSLSSASGTTWTQGGATNTWYATLAGTTDGVWFVDGDGTVHWGTARGSTGAIVALYDYCVTGGNIYVNSGGQDGAHNPNTVWASVEVSQRDHCFWWSPNDYHGVTVDGFEMAYCCGVGISARSGWQIVNNTIHHVGILSGLLDSIGAEFSAGSGGRIANNIIYQVLSYGVNINSQTPFDANNNVIENNTIYNCQYGIHLAPGVAPTAQTNNIVRYNTVYWDGSYTGDMASTYGIFVNGTSLQDAKIYGNLVYGGGSRGIALGAYTQNTTVANNTVKGGAQGIVTFGSNHTGTVIKNNVVVDATQAALYVASSGVIAECDYNLWYAPTGSVYANVNGSSYTTSGFTSYKSATGWDAHGLWQDPVVVSSSDFHLQASSPARNAGVSVGGVVLDRDGKSLDASPDMGAYQYA